MKRWVALFFPPTSRFFNFFARTNKLTNKRGDTFKRHARTHTHAHIHTHTHTYREIKREIKRENLAA